MSRIGPRQKVKRIEEVVHVEQSSKSIGIAPPKEDHHAEGKGISY